MTSFRKVCLSFGRQMGLTYSSVDVSMSLALWLTCLFNYIHSARAAKVMSYGTGKEQMITGDRENKKLSPIVCASASVPSGRGRRPPLQMSMAGWPNCYIIAYGEKPELCIFVLQNLWYLHTRTHICFVCVCVYVHIVCVHQHSCACILTTEDLLWIYDIDPKCTYS